MKLEVGQFVRTKKDIFQVRSNNTTIENKIEYVAVNGRYTHIDINTILKANHNIKELIQENDYVNGNKVININGTLYVKDEGALEDIVVKTVLTHEQFEAMVYRIGE